MCQGFKPLSKETYIDRVPIGDVANLQENINVKDGNMIFGEYKGVRVGVIKTNGKMGTVFPDGTKQP
ncbi:hypothetical protein [Bacillus pseudomycoides]|uniref:hypothetical protein n=1 Tax=Bacillus pseudomycoides TaxID=64104 RepID=UPI003D1CA794